MIPASDLYAEWTALQNEYPTALQDWTLRINRRAMTKLGACKYMTQEIEISIHLLKNGTWAMVRDTLRHEVAHVLAGSHRGHGPVWKVWAKKLGARPERTARGEKAKAMPEHKWGIYCQECREVVARRHRRRMKLHRKQCGKCGGSLAWIRL